VNDITTNKGSECSCGDCQSMCNRPCWPTPEEAKRLIEAGFGDKLMLDHWVGNPKDDDVDWEDYCGDTRILSPACQGSEKRRAPFWPEGRCTMQNEQGLCRLHTFEGLKPIEGRLAACHDGPDDTPSNLHQEVAKLWANPEAQKLCDEWDDMVNEDTLPALKDEYRESEPEVYSVDDEVEVKRTNGEWTRGTIHRIQPLGYVYGNVYTVKVALDEEHYINARGYYPPQKHGYKCNIPPTDIRRV